MMDMFNILGKLGEVKSKMQEVKEKLPFIKVEAISFDQSIKVIATADKKIQSIEIDDSLLSGEKKDQLQEELKETINEALLKAGAKAKEEMKTNLEGTIPNIPGLDFDNLPF